MCKYTKKKKTCKLKMRKNVLNAKKTQNYVFLRFVK